MTLKTIIFFTFLLFNNLCFGQITNESEISYVNNFGNSNIQTLNLKTSSDFKKNIYKFTIGGHYTYGENQGDLSTRNWDINFNGEQRLTKKTSLILGQVTEGNFFTQIKARYNLDIEAKHHLIETKKLCIFVQAGYRYSIEDRYSPLDNSYDNKIRLYQESLRKINEFVSFKFWIEIIQNLTLPKDYLLNAEVSFVSMINSQFSLKFSYKGLFDNQPALKGLKKFDSLTTTSLVTQF